MSLTTWAAGLRAAARDRDATAAIARLHTAFGTVAFRSLARRMRTHPDGRRVLTGRWLFDPAALHHLADLPEGTLGRAWFAWMHGQGFARTIDLPAGPFPEDDDTRYVRLRWQQTHDLRHVLVGLGTTVPDEAVIGAFQAGMLLNAWSVLVALVGPAASGSPRTWTALPAAWRAGREARELAYAPFEELFQLPIDEVRRRYRVRDLSRFSDGRRAGEGTGGHQPR